MSYRAEPVSPTPLSVRARRRATRVGEAILDLRLVRAGMRYHYGMAQLTSGGVTWTAVVSITAVLTVLVNVGRAFLGNNPELFAQGLAAINDVVPGIIDDGTNAGLIQPADLVVESWWNPVTLISSVVVLWTALSVMTGLRRSIRAMFGLGGAPLPITIGKARDLLGFVGLAAAVISASALSAAVGMFGGPILAWLGVEDAATAGLLRAGGLLAGGLVDAVVIVMLFRVTAGVKVVRQDLILGALLGAVLLQLLRYTGTSVINVVDNPVLASFAVIATFMVVVNVGVRIILFVAAWTANPPAAMFPVTVQAIHHRERPNYVTRSAPATLSWPHHAVTGSLQVGNEVEEHGVVDDGRSGASAALGAHAEGR